MDEFENLNHTKWDCKYHVVFIPKYRRKVLYGELKRHLGPVFRQLAEQRAGKPGRGRPFDARSCSHVAVDSAEIRGYTKSLKVRPMGPSPRSDRHDEPRAFNQLVPIETAMIEDVFIVGEDPVGEPIIAHVLPDVLDGIEFG